MDDIDAVGLPTNHDRHGATQREVARHTLTIKQAMELFIAFGVMRSTRLIQRLCEIGTIDCIRVKGEKVERYFIDQPSVERYALELKQLERISHIEDDATPDGNPAPVGAPVSTKGEKCQSLGAPQPRRDTALPKSMPAPKDAELAPRPRFCSHDIEGHMPCSPFA